ncbi:unnamed protein product [Dracunculus medinensis]|uniref:Site-specific DNA-methyltransferase (adenine-specific) n=1 Tax=Dracunculus medinensis TaxID=318479 RepID=A0A158Q3B6_DRAME|nr:unnamed protein product [Dracunculus medinensis]
MDGSALQCSKHLRYCFARNIFFDFKNLNAKHSKRYRNDVILDGDVGGRCDKNFDRSFLLRNADEKSYLQSWGSELQYFKSFDNFIVNKLNCDIILVRPTILIKLDSPVNMYHHFCDFINIYASQHINGSFSNDINIVFWDTWSGGYNDLYFGDTWKVFTMRQPYQLISFNDKKVCFKNVIFSLLARQKFGLYYNMPLIDGCSGSGLFKSFSQHILNRLNISQNGPLLDKIRITLLTRSTEFRRILNENEVD